jgi:phage terminase large subunit
MIRLVNNSEIMFKTGREPDSFRGMTLSWIWIDESCYLDEYVWDVCIGRVLQSGGPIFQTSTPKGFNWVYDKWVEHKDIDIQELLDYSIVKCSSRDNTYISNSNIDSLVRNYSFKLLEIF